MTILFSILGIHLVNVFFIFFTIERAVVKCGVKNTHSISFLIFLLLHPLTNCLAVISIFINGEEGLAAICKARMGKE